MSAHILSGTPSRLKERLVKDGTNLNGVITDLIDTRFALALTSSATRAV